MYHGPPRVDFNPDDFDLDRDREDREEREDREDRRLTSFSTADASVCLGSWGFGLGK